MRKLGSNQHKTRYGLDEKTKLRIALTAVIGLTAISFSLATRYTNKIDWTNMVVPCPDLCEKVYASEITPTPAPAPTWQNITAEIVRVFEKDGKATTKKALDIAFCESGWRAEAENHNTNQTTDYNVFQINDVHVKRYGDKFKTDWQENVRVAHEIYRSHGNSFSAWVCAKKV